MFWSQAWTPDQVSHCITCKRRWLWDTMSCAQWSLAVSVILAALVTSSSKQGCIHAHSHVRTTHQQICTQTRLHVHAHTRFHVHAHTHTHTHTLTHTMHTHIHIHTKVRKTHTQTHTHTHTCSFHLCISFPTLSLTLSLSNFLFPAPFLSTYLFTFYTLSLTFTPFPHSPPLSLSLSLKLSKIVKFSWWVILFISLSQYHSKVILCMFHCFLYIWSGSHQKQGTHLSCCWDIKQPKITNTILSLLKEMKIHEDGMWLPQWLD